MADSLISRGRVDGADVGIAWNRVAIHRLALSGCANVLLVRFAILAALIPGSLWAQSLEPREYDPQFVKQMTINAERQGDVQRGLLWFASAQVACLSCHKVGDYGGSVGPELTTIGKDRSAEQIVESLLWPRREVKPEFMQWTIVKADGSAVQGYRLTESADAITLRDPSTQVSHTIPRDEVDEEIETGTLMPDGLLAAMPIERQLDLIRLLTQLGRDPSLALDTFQATLTHAHKPVPFPVERRPLSEIASPYWQLPVNRDRIYDWYRKQAAHFQHQTHVPRLLAAFPGLDGGDQGHWGNQDETTWSDGRWNQTDLGTVQAGVLHAPGITVARGVCVRVGDYATCFNPDRAAYEVLWKGGFVKFSDVRKGFLNGLTPDGELLDIPESAESQRHDGDDYQYLGYYRRGTGIAFAYRRNGIEYLDVPSVDDGKFHREVAERAKHPQRDILVGGPPQWPQTIATDIVHGGESPYAIDTINLPLDNPWRALLFVGGHDFLADGSAIVATMQGDVWRVTGLDSEQADWRRIAAGLHHCQGVAVVDDTIYVQGRDQLTRLHDRNGDGETDFYECFSNAFKTSAAGHDFICGLQHDPRTGCFYTASGNQGIVEISPKGSTARVVATGFRNPDGLGITPDGTITVPCSEGTWTPASMICAFAVRDRQRNLLHDAGIGGFEPPYFGYPGIRDQRPPDLPLVYIPRGLDNSSSEQVYVNSDRWGPLQGQMIHLSFGAAKHFLLLRDEVQGQLQGGLVELPGEFRSGVHRGRFRATDGQLYVSGMSGWGTYSAEEGCLQRIRYTGDAVQLPVGFHVHENGIMVEFSTPVDEPLAGQVRQHFAQAWNYRYSGAYGSPEFSPSQQGTVGHDVLTISHVEVLGDKRRLFFEIPELQSVNQLHLHVASGSDRTHDLFLTVHALDAPFRDYSAFQARAKQLSRHPIVADIALATRVVPNPWESTIEGARPVTIETGENLTYQTREFQVRSGEPIALRLVNPDVVPHNWALVRPGTLAKVGGLANRLIADPNAVFRHYVPESDDVLAYTDVVTPKTDFTIYFRAPDTPGRYPYLCTFPGHWMVMNGVMVVAESD
ncbi:MAG: hypothetical protein KDA60_02730 [Planctomycetales bacterium]|nr:hypothetical protein [Planctomycetales bacterium]